MGSVSPPVLREAVFEDMTGVQALKRAVGFPDDLTEDWDWLWRSNPSWNTSSQKPSIGWVLEIDGRIVGYLASVPSLVRYNEKSLLAATASGYAVDRAFRGHSLRLAAAFFNQAGIDIFINTTATEASGKIFQLFNAIPVPQENYGTVLFWVLRPRGFINATLRSINFPPPIAKLASGLFSFLLWSDIRIRRKAPPKKPRKPAHDLSVHQVDVADLGDEIDELWSRKIQTEQKLMSYRTADVLRWHFAKTKAKVLYCDFEGKLAGYAVVTREDLPDIGLSRSKIVDIIVEEDEPEILDQLLSSAYLHAKADGSHVLEAVGFPTAIRHRMHHARPYSRKLRHWPYFYLAVDPSLHAELQEQHAWYACPFDGDASLF